MRIAILAAVAASLTACSAGPAPWQAKTIPVVVIASVSTPKSPRCPPIDADVAREAKRMTPLELMRDSGMDGLTAALMRSEADKNARLRQAVMAYERCRGHQPLIPK
jgi:hypothetical protein